MFIDTHAHLDNDLFDSDREAMIGRAFEQGIERIVTIGTDMDSCLRAIALAEKYDGVYAVIGLHPTDSVSFEDKMIDQLRVMAQHAKVVGIGEIGLDYYWKDSPPDIQQKVFRKMIRLACELDKPIVIHNREADADILRILKEEKASHQLNNLRGIMHCFSGDEAIMKESLALHFYISFAGNVTYKKSKLADIVPLVPEDRLLIETDAPYLTPVPFRGQRNEPAHVRHTAEKIASLLGKDPATIGRQTAHNARAVFGLV